MSDPLKTNQPPEDVLPYAPNWARNPGYRPSQPGASYDAFSEEENPSYRSMAQMFAPETERQKKKSNGTAKMLLRFGAVVGVASAALALFIGYIATQPNSTETAVNEKRFEDVNNAVSAIQAVLTPSPAPAAATASVETSASPVAVAPSVAAAPEPAPAAPPSAAASTSLSTDRGAAPMPPPPEAPATVRAPDAPQVAALPSRDIAPAPPPAPVVPQLTAGELTTLMARGRRFVENGDFSSARPVYRRAAEAGYAEAALALGETYDPVTLQERGVVGMGSDIKQARHWYERAREMGSLEAPTRLGRLPRN